MRGSAARQITMLASLSPDQLIPPDHPIRRVKPIVDAALAVLSPLFDAMYAEGGRPSIRPQHLLKASLLMALYSIRSERQFCERLQYDLLFKWFLDMNVEDPAFDQSRFAKNRNGCWITRCRVPSSRRCWSKRGSGGCCRGSTSRWTGRCWSRGPR